MLCLHYNTVMYFRENAATMPGGKHASSYVGKLIKIKLFMFINSSPQLPEFKLKQT